MFFGFSQAKAGPHPRTSLAWKDPFFYGQARASSLMIPIAPSALLCSPPPLVKSVVARSIAPDSLAASKGFSSPSLSLGFGFGGHGGRRCGGGSRRASLGVRLVGPTCHRSRPQRAAACALEQGGSGGRGAGARAWARRACGPRGSPCPPWPPLDLEEARRVLRARPKLLDLIWRRGLCARECRSVGWRRMTALALAWAQGRP